MNINVIYNEDCIKGMSNLDYECVDLVIADPPYFKVVGEKWDYLWRTEDDYLKWSAEWIREASNALRTGGSFFVFGYFRMLSRLLPILESFGLELRQQIVIDKGMRAVSGRATKKYRMFPNVTESILFLYKDNKPFVREFLKGRQKELGLSSREINESLGVKSNGGGMWSIYTGKNICEQFPTEEIWHRLEDVLKFSYPYNKISQTFNPQLGFTDVWRDIDFYSEKDRIHPTQKPLKLIERIILTSSNEGDFVLDPFMGGGTTALACRNLRRDFIGFETDTEYYIKAMERLK